MIRLTSKTFLEYKKDAITIPPAIIGPRKSAKPNSKLRLAAGLELVPILSSFPLTCPDFDISWDFPVPEAGFKTKLILPREDPRCSANHILPWSSGASH